MVTLKIPALGTTNAAWKLRRPSAGKDRYPDPLRRARAAVGKPKNDREEKSDDYQILIRHEKYT
jgi:hypothetical protein